MKKYELMATEFIIKIKENKAKTDKVFMLNKVGKRVLNKKTKAYQIVNDEINFLLDIYSKGNVKNIIGIYNKFLIDSNLVIYKDLIKFIFTPYYSSINKEYKDNLTERTNNAILIKNGKDLINLASNFIQSYDYKKITIGLAILTGRRTSEILKSGSFEKIDDCHLLFTGQLKQKDSESYVIPILGNSDAIIKALENLRVIKSYKSISHVNKRESGVLNKAVKKHLKKWHNSLKMHDLRRVYTYICYNYHFHSEAKANQRQTFEGYTMEILGHRAIESGKTYRVLEVEM